MRGNEDELAGLERHETSRFPIPMRGNETCSQAAHLAETTGFRSP